MAHRTVSVGIVAALFGLAVCTQAQGQVCREVRQGGWTIEKLEKLKTEDADKNLSGLACAPAEDGERRCILVQDEKFRAAFARLSQGKITVRKAFKLPRISRKNTNGAEFDAEAAAWSDGQFYVLGSHSVKGKSCAPNRDSRQLVRFSSARERSKPKFERARPILDLIGHDAELIRHAGQCLGRAGRPENATGDWKPNQGLNFEGLAVTGSHVLLGLRGPVMAGKAVVVKAGRAALFDRSPQQPAEVFRLTLEPAGGIRDLAALPGSGGILILSGSEDDNTGGAAIHRWDGKSATVDTLCRLPDPVAAGSKQKPEALLVLEHEAGKLRVLVVSDGVSGGRPQEYEISLPAK